MTYNILYDPIWLFWEEILAIGQLAFICACPLPLHPTFVPRETSVPEPTPTVRALLVCLATRSVCAGVDHTSSTDTGSAAQQDSRDHIEAAHIYPYHGPETNHLANGLLLRGDIHSLFDQGLLAVDTATMTILVSPALQGSEYERFANQPLRLPADARLHPSKEALDLH